MRHGPIENNYHIDLVISDGSGTDPDGNDLSMFQSLDRLEATLKAVGFEVEQDLFKTDGTHIRISFPDVYDARRIRHRGGGRPTKTATGQSLDLYSDIYEDGEPDPDMKAAYDLTEDYTHLKSDTDRLAWLRDQGAPAVTSAFGISRSTYYRWIHRLEVAIGSDAGAGSDE